MFEIMVVLTAFILQGIVPGTKQGMYIVCCLCSIRVHLCLIILYGETVGNRQAYW